MPNEENKNIIVEAVGLSKTFHDFWNRPKAKAVDDIDFEIYQGEVVAILGPNGSGKSTTIKMLLGLLYPTSGSVSIFDTNPRNVQIKKRIGYLPEESYLYKHLTALETLDFYGALFNLSAAERKDRSHQLLDMVGLSHARHRSVGEFSKGMARRIGLAQAMINDPDLLILDEPTSGLDPLGCKEMKDLISLLRDRGKTVIVSSHLLSDVEDVCDRVIILYGGRIRATGSVSELLTVSNVSTITTPTLEPAVTEKLLKLLRKNFNENEFKIDHPTRSLEEFFLDVVDQAIYESVETSGVISGGEIPNYLMNAKEEHKKILEELTKPKKTEKKKNVEDKIKKAVDIEKKEKLDNLVDSEKKTEKRKQLSEEEQKKISDANEKLKHLIK